MSIFGKLRQIAARWALEREIFNELSQITDEELTDLDLSRSKLVDLSRRQARAAIH